MGQTWNGLGCVSQAPTSKSWLWPVILFTNLSALNPVHSPEFHNGGIVIISTFHWRGVGDQVSMALVPTLLDAMLIRHRLLALFFHRSIPRLGTFCSVDDGGKQKLELFAPWGSLLHPTTGLEFPALSTYPGWYWLLVSAARTKHQDPAFLQREVSEGDVYTEIYGQAVWDMEEKKCRAVPLSEAPGFTTRDTIYLEVAKNVCRYTR